MYGLDETGATSCFPANDREVGPGICLMVRMQALLDITTTRNVELACFSESNLCQVGGCWKDTNAQHSSLRGPPGLS